jgi:hypothetical protein
MLILHKGLMLEEKVYFRLNPKFKLLPWLTYVNIYFGLS